MCVCVLVCEGEKEREIHPPSWMVRCLSLKPADEARVYAALGGCKYQFILQQNAQTDS